MTDWNTDYEEEEDNEVVEIYHKEVHELLKQLYSVDEILDVYQTNGVQTKESKKSLHAHGIH